MAAYNNYFPASYQPMYQQLQYPQPVQMQAQPQIQQPQNNSINWVQGEAAARAFAVAPGQSAMLMDSESSVFYIKTSDASGMPLPLRIFDYTERNQHQANVMPQIQNAQTEFITREEFEQRISELTQLGSQSKVASTTRKAKAE